MTELQRLADKLGIAIRISHFPPGTVTALWATTPSESRCRLRLWSA